MNPLLVKAIPYLGWPLAAAMFFLWLGLKEDLAQQIEICNQEKLESIAQAERLTREAVQMSLDRRLRELEAIALAESNARQAAETARAEAEAGATNAQNTIRRLMREAENDETATIESVCLNVDIPASALSGLRN